MIFRCLYNSEIIQQSKNAKHWDTFAGHCTFKVGLKRCKKNITQPQSHYTKPIQSVFFSLVDGGFEGVVPHGHHP